MIEQNEKIIDFEVYKYVASNIFYMVALILVLIVTLVLYVICLPFIWFTPTHRLFIYFECLIKELT
jgi:hypothetical protein